MNIKITKNKYVDAFLLLMMFSAALHMIILLIQSLYEGNVYILNYFNILDLDLFISGISNTFWCNFFSGVVALIIYLLILKVNKSE